MLPPESVPIRRPGRWRPDVELLDELAARSSVDGRAVDGAAPPVGLLADALEHQVELDRPATDDPLAQAVVRDVAEPESLARRDAWCRVMDLPASSMRPGIDAPLTCDRLGERALAVAVDARDAQDLAGADTSSETSATPC